MRVFHHDLTIMYHHHGISFMAKIDFAAISYKNTQHWINPPVFSLVV